MKIFSKVSVRALIVSFVLGLVGPMIVFSAGPATINLGSASNYVVLSKTAITTTGVTSITGDIAISPAFSTDTSGFSLSLDGSGTFSTSALITGRIYAADYSAPTPATLTTAISAMEAAYTDGAGRTPGVGASNLNLGGGTLSGHNLVPGTYTWGSNVSITNDITFTGSASDVWILQISGNLSIETSKKIILAGGALPQNIFWVVAGTTTLKPGSTFNGIILAGPGASTIAMQSGAILYGRALGQTDVTFIGNTVTAVAPTPATLNVIKTVINDNGGTAVASNFTTHVKLSGIDVAGSPLAGVASPGTAYSLSAGTYMVSENTNTSYAQSFSGDCDSSGSVTLVSGDNKTCTIINNDIASGGSGSGGGPQYGTINVVKTVINDNGGTKTIADFPLFVNGAPVTSGVTNTFPLSTGNYIVTETSDPKYTKTFSGDCDINGQINLNSGYNRFCIVTNNDIGASSAVVSPVPPLIDVVKTANPLALTSGAGSVTYTYTLRNTGTVPVTDITMVGDTCSPVVRISGDTNSNNKLDLDETWVHTCTKTLSTTHTNTVVATGWANGISAVDITSATVVVGVSTIPPLIHVTKKPNLFVVPFGGVVTYTYTVTNPGTAPLSNVSISDDKCTGLPGRVAGHPGDLNKNNLLESNEAWSFTCQSKLTQTTVNTGTAEGTANGLTVRDFALATVVVTPPKLPKTGFFSEEKNTPWNIIIPAGIVVALLSIFLIKKKKMI